MRSRFHLAILASCIGGLYIFLLCSSYLHEGDHLFQSYSLNKFFTKKITLASYQEDINKYSGVIELKECLNIHKFQSIKILSFDNSIYENKNILNELLLLKPISYLSIENIRYYARGPPPIT